MQNTFFRPAIKAAVSPSWSTAPLSAAGSAALQRILQHAIPSMSEGRRWHQGRPIWYRRYMAIDVSREFEAELESRLRSGRYRSAEELLREALHLVDERDEIREAVAQGAAEADRGEFVDGEAVVSEARKLIRQKAEAGHGG